VSRSSNEASPAEDARFLRRALALARRGRGETNPNPMVGCVIVRAGQVVGEGWHRRAGGPHAEAIALRQAGDRARGATLYVNLEPCSHLAKRTPPCAPAIVSAGIARVVASMPDPNPAVRGRGFRALRRAGVRVTSGVMAEDAAVLNAVFVGAQRRQRPFVLLKAAMTLDGRIATAAGESKWITSSAQRAAARRLRRDLDGVAVGLGTVVADDPRLLPSPMTRRHFYRVVFDSRLRLPLTSRLVRTARLSPVVVVCAKAPAARRRRLEEAGLTVLAAGGRGRVGIDAALKSLWRHGLRSLMVEGGSELLGSFLAAGTFDQIALFRAPVLMGGRQSRPAFGGPGPRRLAEAWRLRGPKLPGFELWYPRG
jgi:diaminohydroxyphosphoribosylaminopyrimidine deaminase/5-amino-6-(5-phosphoribosylamino)uracil reductase